MLTFTIITIIFIGVLFGMNKILDVDKVKKNWSKYRCRPDIMIMADLYGHSAAENIEFCLKNGFDERAKETLGPFYTFLGSFVAILTTLLKSINSIRMIFATIVGSISQVFGEFSTRIQTFFYTIQNTFFRMRFLFTRLFATMYSIIFMGMAGIKAMDNFGNTFLFKFLDTFCFAPETPVLVLKGDSYKYIPIQKVRIGDVLKDGSKVTATFQFFSDGQEMRTLARPDLPIPIEVSTNHYLLHKSKWIKVEDHPNALSSAPWSGGLDRPLICLNTDTHRIPIGDYIFCDYDESEEGDQETMQTVLNQLNNSELNTTRQYSYTTSFTQNTKIKLKNGKSVPANEIKLGDGLSNGNVVGIVLKESSELCRGDLSAGTAVWWPTLNQWVRAGDFYPVEKLEIPLQTISFVVSPSAMIELEDGTVLRDYVEIHSPDTENAYTKALNNASSLTPLGE